jgi:hypothetical protein
MAGISPRWLIRKCRYELQGLYALVKYPFAKDALLARLRGTMPTVSIETTNICNADCVFCAYQYQQRATGVMSMALFQKVVDEFAEVGGGRLALTPTVGDPLVDKHILGRIRYARSVPQITHIGMCTNMISLERFGADAVVRSGLTSLIVSTSGFDARMYERVYRSREYPRVLRSILAFAEANNAAGRPVDLRIELRVDRPAAEVLASADFRTVAELVGAERIGIKYRYDHWSGRITQQQLSGTMRLRGWTRIRAPRMTPCSELYSGPMVYWDGRVGACGCRDLDARELIIGDANVSHIADIWLGDEIRRLRAQFLTPKIRPICASCTHYQNLSIVLRRDQRDYLSGLRPLVFHRRAPVRERAG